MLAPAMQHRELWERQRNIVKAIVIAFPLGIASAAMKYLEFDLIVQVNSSAASTLSFLMSVFVAFRASQAYGRFWEGTTAIFRIRGHFYDVMSTLVAFSRCSQQPEATIDDFRHTLVRLFSLLETLMLAELSHEDTLNGSEKAFDYDIIDPEYFDERTISHLKEASFPLELVVQWIQSVIVEGMESKILSAPPPVCTRAFQELQAGITWFHVARRITEVPLPLPYRVSTQIVLLINCAVMPFAACSWSSSWIICGMLSMCQVCAFIILHHIAGEMENPFGSDANDLDVESGHVDFNNKLWALLTSSMHITPKRRSTDRQSSTDSDRVHVSSTLKGIFGTTGRLSAVDSRGGIRFSKHRKTSLLWKASSDDHRNCLSAKSLSCDQKVLSRDDFKAVAPTTTTFSDSGDSTPQVVNLEEGDLGAENGRNKILAQSSLHRLAELQDSQLLVHESAENGDQELGLEIQDSQLACELPSDRTGFKAVPCAKGISYAVV